jgi:hypothetical protein
VRSRGAQSAAAREIFRGYFFRRSRWIAWSWAAAAASSACAFVIEDRISVGAG